MIDYAKHIDVLIDLRTYHSAPTREHQETLTAMIELMRAAAPKDAEAEREYCADVLDHAPDVRDSDFTDTVDLIVRLRASARAEGDVQGYTRACLTRVVEVEVELAACKAEIERLRAEAAELKRRATLYMDEQSFKTHEWKPYVSGLETKLTNLRAAARRLAQHFQGTGVVSVVEGNVFVAAIEASR